MMYDTFESVRAVIIFIIVCLILLGACFWLDEAQEKELRECFYMENRTKECEYLLFKAQSRGNSLSNGVLTGMIIGGAIGRR